MFSLYIHIPFCSKKCHYCSFFTVPIEKIDSKEKFVWDYAKSLLKELDFWKTIFPWEEIKTIYFWGGTPLRLWKQNIIEILDKILESFDCSFLEEVNFELNPEEEVFYFIETINKKYRSFFRIRYTFGLQSFDDEILKKTDRWYIYNYLLGFLRKLQNYKALNNVFNFDFIAFWKFNKDKNWQDQLWTKQKLNFLEDFVKSFFADSFSVYMLELFPWAYRYDRYNLSEISKYISQDSVYEEFVFLSDLISSYAYKRYEISNFSLAGKECLHNMVYWNMEEYIWIGMNSSSYLWMEKAQKLLDYKNIKKDDFLKWIRFANTTSWKDYFWWNFLKEIDFIDKTEYLIQKFFLWMRKKEWIKNIYEYKNVFVKDYEQKIKEFEQKELLEQNWSFINLTNKGFDFYNYIITELIKEF